MLVAANRKTGQVEQQYKHSEKVIKYLKGGINQWTGYTGYNADFGDTGYNILPWEALQRGIAPLKYGDKGAIVAYLQGLLTATGHVPSSNDTQSGQEVFGTSTQAMVQEFQTQAGLSPVDGIVGRDTWSSLQSTASMMNATVKTPPILTSIENIFYTPPSTPATSTTSLTIPPAVPAQSASSKVLTYTLIGGGILGTAILVMRMLNK